MTNKLMFQFRSQHAPTLDDVIKRFGFHAEDMDTAFGVVPIDPDDNLYTVLVDERAKDHIFPAREVDSVTGFYANPRVEPMA